MSYDIYFVRRDPSQSFEDALEETEDSFEGDDPGPLTEDDLEQWDEVLPTARAVLGEIEQYEDEATRELTDPATGIQLSLFHGEIAIRVPGAARPAENDAVMTKVYDLARAVEQVTGLEGYDPQLEEPISDRAELVQVAAPVAGHEQIRRHEPERTSTLVGAAPDRSSAPGGSSAEPHRWWEFWHR